MIKPFDAQQQAAWKIAVSESERLWPDPFDAPEVPARELLQEWCENPQVLKDRDLMRQIADSPSCQRAIAEIRDEHLLGLSIDKAGIEALKRSGKAPLPTAPLKCAPPIPYVSTLQMVAMSGKQELSPGALIRCRRKIPVLEDASLAWRFLREPPILILLDRRTSNEGLAKWFAAPCSPASHWKDFFSSDELVVKVLELGHYTIHLWAELIVAEEHIDVAIGSLERTSLEKIRCARLDLEASCSIRRELHPGPKRDLKLDECTSLERERLAATRSWLVAALKAAQHARKKIFE